MSDKIKMRDGDTMLIMMKGGEVIHFTPNMSLPHSEFVKRTTGQLPTGAWVGTASKLDGEVAAITSKHFFGYQLPAPAEVAEAVRRTFEWWDTTCHRTNKCAASIRRYAIRVCESLVSQHHPIRQTRGASAGRRTLDTLECL